MSSTNSSQVLILAIVDGWGIAPQSDGNAISRAQTPNIDHFWKDYPHTSLKASGEAVGLPMGEAGNTETGHLNVGAGRIIYQDLERINMSIAEGDFFKNPVFLKAFEHVKHNNSNLHLMGLLGEGGVHSSSLHLFSLIEMAAKRDVKNLYLHIFTDGRDSPPMSAMNFINKLKVKIEMEGVGKIASVMGRYWAMDRDHRWERTQKAYDALTKGNGNRFESVEQAIDNAYRNGKTDEFIEPASLVENGEPIAVIKDNDAVIFYNFRIDRPRQLTKAFVMDDFKESASIREFDPYKIKYEKRHSHSEEDLEKPFERGDKLKNLFFVSMTEYSKLMAQEGAIPAFPPETIQNTIGEVLEKNNKKQLRITESEKERFVTYYFNGFRDEPFEHEQKLIVPSPKVPTYDLKPEMSSEELTEKLILELEKKIYDLVVINFPNPDMVGHTGDIDAAVKAVEAVDKCLGKIYHYITEHDGTLIVTADHGNAEAMLDLETGDPVTEHSTNPVPFIIISNKYIGNSVGLPPGKLADIAPSILSLMGIPKPLDMTGDNLVEDLNNN